MIIADNAAGTTTMSGTTSELLNDFANIAAGLYAALSEDLPSIVAEVILENALECGIKSKPDHYTRVRGKHPGE